MSIGPKEVSHINNLYLKRRLVEDILDGSTTAVQIFHVAFPDGNPIWRLAFHWIKYFVALSVLVNLALAGEEFLGTTPYIALVGVAVFFSILTVLQFLSSKRISWKTALKYYKCRNATLEVSKEIYTYWNRFREVDHEWFNALRGK